MKYSTPLPRHQRSIGWQRIDPRVIWQGPQAFKTHNFIFRELQWSPTSRSPPFSSILLGQGLFRCNLCRLDRKQVPGSGYSNLITHLAGQHAGYEAQYAASIPSASRSLQSFGFACEEISHLFQWIRWIIEQNMPIHEVEDILTRAMSKLRPVTVKAVKKCMEGIAIAVGLKLEKELGTLFDLMFDGWTLGCVHYIGLYAVYEADDELRVPLLGLSPLTDGNQICLLRLHVITRNISVTRRNPPDARHHQYDSAESNPRLLQV